MQLILQRDPLFDTLEDAWRIVRIVYQSPVEVTVNDSRRCRRFFGDIYFVHCEIAETRRVLTKVVTVYVCLLRPAPSLNNQEAYLIFCSFNVHDD